MRIHVEVSAGSFKRYFQVELNGVCFRGAQGDVTRGGHKGRSQEGYKRRLPGVVAEGGHSVRLQGTMVKWGSV